MACHRPSTEAYVKALEQMAEIMDRHVNDCERMGRALKRFMDQRGDAIRQYSDASHRLSRTERAKLEGPRFGPRIRQSMKKIMPGHHRCHHHPKVREAFLEL